MSTDGDYAEPDAVTISWSLVLGFFGGDGLKTALWFSTPNPLLGGASPGDMLMLGRAEMLLRVIRELLAENEPPAALRNW